MNKRKKMPIFIGIDYSPTSLAIVAQMEEKGLYIVHALVCSDKKIFKPRHEYFVKDFDIRFIIHITKRDHCFHQDKDITQNHKLLKKFLLTSLEKIEEVEPNIAIRIGIEDNLHVYNGSNQFTQMSEIRAILNLTCRERPRYKHCHIIPVNSARQTWLLEHPNIRVRQVWRDNRRLPIKNRLKAIWLAKGLPDIFPQNYNSNTYHPVGDIVDGFVMCKAIQLPIYHKPPSSDGLIRDIQPSLYDQKPLRCFLSKDTDDYREGEDQPIHNNDIEESEEEEEEEEEEDETDSDSE